MPQQAAKARLPKATSASRSTAVIHNMTVSTDTFDVILRHIHSVSMRRRQQQTILDVFRIGLHSINGLDLDEKQAAYHELQINIFKPLSAYEGRDEFSLRINSDDNTLLKTVQADYSTILGMKLHYKRTIVLVLILSAMFDLDNGDKGLKLILGNKNQNDEGH